MRQGDRQVVPGERPRPRSIRAGDAFVYTDLMGSCEGLSLPPGYRLALDPDLLVLRRPDGSTVSVFSACGAVPEYVDTAARDDAAKDACTR